MPIIPGGLWFKDNCLKITPNKKTETVKVRYRYPGEDWVEVDGDDFELKKTHDLSNRYFSVYADVTVQIQNDNQNFNYQGYKCGDSMTMRSTMLIRGGEILDYEFISTEGNLIQLILTFANKTETVSFRWADNNGYHPTYLPLVYYLPNCIQGDPNLPTKVGAKNPRNLKFLDNGGSTAEVKKCILSIFKNEQKILEVTNEECPEVEFVSDGHCVEDESTKISIKTTPLGFIHVTKAAADQQGEPEAAIPDECVNIYKVDVIHQLLSPLGALSDTIYTLIGQYCSTPGCESPIVIRDGDQCGESCPDDTCAVRCSDHICCHDKDGVAVEEIALENYAGEQT